MLRAGSQDPRERAARAPGDPLVKIGVLFPIDGTDAVPKVQRHPRWRPWHTVRLPGVCVAYHPVTVEVAVLGVPGDRARQGVADRGIAKPELSLRLRPVVGVSVDHRPDELAAD